MPLIRPATSADLPALHQLVESAYRGDAARAGWTHESDLLGGRRSDVAMLAASLADPARVLLLAADGDAIVGSVEVVRLAPDLAYLGLLSVDPGRQGSGLGRRLIAAAEDAARARGATRMEMTVIGLRAELIAWYERRGYARTGETRPFIHPAERLGTHDLTMVVLDKRLDRPADARKSPA